MNINYARSSILMGPINHETGSRIFADTAKAIEKDPNAETFLIINSGGGIVDVGNMITSLLPGLSPKLVTVGSGLVGSMAIPVFLCGASRYITRHTRFFFHEIGRNYKDTRMGVGDVKSDLDDLRALQKWYIEYIVERTGGKLSAKRLNRLMVAETTLYPDQMKDLGLFDRVI